MVSRWLDPLSVATVSEQSVVLEAPNTFFRDWVAAHYLELLRAHTGGRELQIVTSVASPAPSAPPPMLAAPRNPSAAPRWDHGLNPKFSFDHFVVGPSNRFAHAASLAVAESPAKAYNPLFIYGGVGLGKTHLMQAIGQAIVGR